MFLHQRKTQRDTNDKLENKACTRLSILKHRSIFSMSASTMPWQSQIIREEETASAR